MGKSRKDASLFQFIDREMFNKLAIRHQIDKGVRSLSTFDLGDDGRAHRGTDSPAWFIARSRRNPRRCTLDFIQRDGFATERIFPGSLRPGFVRNPQKDPMPQGQARDQGITPDRLDRD